MSQVPIIIAGAAAVIFAVVMVTRRSLYACSVCLLAVLLQAAALFFFMGAPILAFLQVMIYAGAVMVLIVVTIMAAPTQARRALEKPSAPWVLAVIGLAAPVVEAGVAVFKAGLGRGQAWTASGVQTRLGEILFGPYALATEAVGILIFLAALAVADLKKSEEASS